MANLDPHADITPDEAAKLAEQQARRDDDDDDDAPRQRPTTSGANVAAAGAGAAAGIGIGAIVLIIGGIVGCCVCLPGIVVSVAVVLVQKAATKAIDIAALNQLRMVSLACHEHQDRFKSLPSPRMQPQPPANISPELSWRVSILSTGMMGQQGLFNDFDKNQPWNSPRNQPLVNRGPMHYTLPKDPDRTQTKLQYFTGPNTMFPDPIAKMKLTDIKDGSGNTFLVAEAASAVPWSKPADMAVGGGALPLPADRFFAAFGDGSVRVINRSSASDEILRQAINPKDGKAMPAGWGD